MRPWNHCDVIQVTFGVQTSHFVIQGEISEQKPYKLCGTLCDYFNVCKNYYNELDNQKQLIDEIESLNNQILFN